MTEPRVVTDRTTFLETASDAAADARVPVEVRVPVADTFDAYRRARDGRGGFHLETTGGQDGWGYFGVTATDRLTVGPDDGPAIDALVDRLAGESLARGDCDVPYPCGAVGWLSYDVARDLEDLPETTERDRDLPRLQIGVYDCLAAWEAPGSGGSESDPESGDSAPGPESGDTGSDRESGDTGSDRESGDAGSDPGDDETTLHVTACPRLDAFADHAAAYEDGRDRALALATAAVEGDPSVGDPPVSADEARFESDCGREAFADRVRTVKQYVRDGDTFQANVSQRLRAPAAVHPVEVFAALRAVNPAPYSGLLEFPGVDLVSASPELLLSREGDRLVTEPIAGTRPRGTTADEDEFLAEDLRTDEKERAEHAMLVDLERNDLGKVSEFGSVDVSEYRRVDRYSEVMHLVSLVEGRLREGADLGDAIAAVFPGGTVTGAPKPRTMAIIDEVETTQRGPYTGSIGVFGFDGRATLNIVIRTLVRYGDEYHLRVGAGIVHDSIPDREYEETLDKGRALVNAVDDALGARAAFTVEDPDP